MKQVFSLSVSFQIFLRMDWLQIWTKLLLNSIILICFSYNSPSSLKETFSLSGDFDIHIWNSHLGRSPQDWEISTQDGSSQPAQRPQGIQRLPNGIRWCRGYYRRPDAMEILAVESKQMYEQRSSMLEEQEELKKIIRLGSLQRWQEKRDASEKGRWTHRLITQVDNWVNRKHGEVNYYLTQMLSNHRCFRAYLYLFKHEETPQCPAGCPRKFFLLLVWPARFWYGVGRVCWYRLSSP